MQRKNATIQASHIFGTANGWSVAVSYRGQVLRSWQGLKADRDALHQSAREFARGLGFTHANGRSLSARAYIQLERNGQRETVDEFDAISEARAMLAEYRMADPSGRYWTSSRACRAWLAR